METILIMIVLIMILGSGSEFYWRRGQLSSHKERVEN